MVNKITKHLPELTKENLKRQITTIGNEKWKHY